MVVWMMEQGCVWEREGDPCYPYALEAGVDSFLINYFLFCSYLRTSLPHMSSNKQWDKRDLREMQAKNGDTNTKSTTDFTAGFGHWFLKM